MKRVIVRASTLAFLAAGTVFAFMMIYGGSVTQELPPELVGKEVIFDILKKNSQNISDYDLADMELLHIHKTGQVYLVDQDTLRDTLLYQENLPNFPHDIYVWRMPFTNEKSAHADSNSTIFDASSGEGIGNIFPRADCPLGGLGHYENGINTEYLVYYAILSNGNVSYIDPSLRGTFIGNQGEYQLINMTRNYPDVTLMLNKYNHVCVNATPTNLYFKTDPHYPDSKNQVEYLAIGRSGNQIILTEKFDSVGKNIGRVLYCGNDNQPVYNPSLETVSACFNSTYSNS